jgi:ABC-type transport system substrate-binding protein
MKKISFSLLAVFFGLSLLTMLAGLPMSGRLQEEKPKPGGTLHLKPFSDTLNINLDPAKEADVFLLEQLYDGLVRLDKDLNVAPALAEYWTISPDGKTSTFYLRRGVQFHNGQELTSEDVKFSLERLLDPKVSSPYSYVFMNHVAGAKEFWDGRAPAVSGFKAVDRYVFEIQWTNPFVSSLYLLSLYYCKVVPRDLVRARGDGFFWRPVGSGPFKFTYWLRSNRLDVVGVHLERNPRYFGGPPYLEAVEYSPFFTLDHFRNKEIDIIPFLSEGLADSDCQIQKEGSLDGILLGMSCQQPPLDNPLVRRALSLVVDRRRIAQEATSSESLPQLIDNFIPAQLPGFCPSDKSWSNNIEEARQLLRREGYPGEKDLPPLVLYARLPRRNSYYRIFVELQKQLEDLGFRLSLRYFREDREILELKKPYLILVEWRIDSPDADNIIRPLFYSQSPKNLTRYSNALFDQWLDKAAAQRSWSKRIDIFQQAEGLLFKDIPAVPLFSNLRRMAIQPYVRGVEVPPLGFSHLDTTKIWISKRD